MTSRGQNSVTMETKINFYCGITKYFYVTTVHCGLNLCNINSFCRTNSKSEKLICQCSSVYFQFSGLSEYSGFASVLTLHFIASLSQYCLVNVPRDGYSLITIKVMFISTMQFSSLSPSQEKSVHE